MSLLTNIVKSFAVVDKRNNKHEDIPLFATAGRPVIKNRVVQNGLPVIKRDAPGTKQGFIDELNRLRVEIAEAKAQLRTLKGELGEAKERKKNPPRGAGAEAQAGEGGDQSRLDEARRLKDEAEAQAEQIILQAQTDGKLLAEQARQDGYLEGYSAGFEQARQEYVEENAPAAQQLQEMLCRISAYEQKKIQENEAAMVDLIIAVAEKVIGREVRADPRAVADMLRELLEENRREEYIKITVARDLMPVSAEATAEIRGLLGSMGANITVNVDDMLVPGGLLVETAKGLTDVSISSQLNNLAQALRAE